MSNNDEAPFIWEMTNDKYFQFQHYPTGLFQYNHNKSLWVDNLVIPSSHYQLWAKTAIEAMRALEREDVYFIDLCYDLGYKETELWEQYKNGYDIIKGFTLLPRPIYWRLHEVYDPAIKQLIYAKMREIESQWLKTYGPNYYVKYDITY